MQQATSLADLLRRSCSANADKAAMLLPQSDSVKTITYKELYDLVYSYARVLDSMGLKRGDRVSIFSENAPEWMFADWACQTLGIVVAPIYPTLPADQAMYIVKDSGAKLVIAGDKKHQDDIQSVPTILLKGAPESLEAKATAGEGTLTREAWEASIDAAKLDDIATIIYTSGTTGNPKGAMLAHRGFVWIVEAVLQSLPLGPGDTFFSFLPMSHVFERVNGQALAISLGATIGYMRNLKTLSNDLVAIKPTVMMTVPRFLEAMIDRIMDATKKQSPLQQKLFTLALEQGKKKFHGGFAPLFPLTNGVVGKKIRERLGGRMRFFVAGGAALPAHVAEFYGAFGIKILQGYGLTETSSGIAVNHPDRLDVATVGEILPGMECKIAADGEILLRGPAIMTGYHNLPEATAEAIDKDGWFHTGDIGELDGVRLRITDRKKDLLVLGNGKNVAPQPIENKLRASRFISEAVVLGDGMENCVALIVPNAEAVRSELGLAAGVKLSESAEAKALITSEVQAVNKTNAPFESVKRTALLDDPFTIESGELTPSMKVKRKVVKERYADLIAGLRN